jgi:hypothetical protein
MYMILLDINEFLLKTERRRTYEYKNIL